MHYLEFSASAKDTLYVHSGIPLHKNLFHIKTVEKISNANQLIGFYMKQDFTKIYFWKNCTLKSASFVDQYQMNYLLQVYYF